MDLAGKGAVVTGGGRGIGAAIARALAARGAKVLVAARSRDQVDAVARELGAAGHVAFAATLDVSDPASIKALAAEATRALGAVDVLVNNAGIATSASVKNQTLEDWNRVLTVNATGVFLMTQTFMGGMMEREWGRVINIASIMSKLGAPYTGAYAASKHAVLGFSRCAAAEGAPRGVTVNCVCPGYVATDMMQASIANVTRRTQLDEAAAVEAVLASVGQRRLITPDEVAAITAYLASPAAGAVTAQAIVLDGGALYA